MSVWFLSVGERCYPVVKDWDQRNLYELMSILIHM